MLFLIPVFFLSFSLEAKNIYDFSNENLEQYLIMHYGVTVYGLTRGQAIQIINQFKSNNPPKPLNQSFIKPINESTFIKPVNESKKLLIAEL